MQLQQNQSSATRSATASGWPVRRMPKWWIAVAAVLVLAAVAVGLAHRPTNGQRATDLTGVVQTLNTDIQSCAGGVRESLQALREVQAGATRQVANAESVANQGAANCMPANNQLIDDLENYQVPESLASFRLQSAINDLITWAAPNAIAVQTDVAAVLQARGTPAEAAAQAKLTTALHKLDAERAAFAAILQPAIRSLHPAASALTLPG
jgi:hypothetical protein